MGEDTKLILESKISQMLIPLGYDLVDIDWVLKPPKKLRIFIDRIDHCGHPIGIEDCIKCSKLIDEPLDHLKEIDEVFGGSYELEVSSPGINRRLKKRTDFERFMGKLVRIQAFRPLTQQEIENIHYLQKNPKQKNFVGTIAQVQDQKITLSLVPDNTQTLITIPFNLISKACLEVDLNQYPLGGKKL